MGISIYTSYSDELTALREQMRAKTNLALEMIGMSCEAYAKMKCPVDTGRLRNSITHQVSIGEKAVYVGTNVEYAAYVEMGTQHMKPQPYLKPAAEGHLAEYKAMAETVLRG